MTAWQTLLSGMALLWSLLSTSDGVAALPPAEPSVAFHYGEAPPIELLNQFDWVVVESANISSADHQRLTRFGTEVFAYISVGELDRWRARQPGLPEGVLRATNSQWQSQAVDLTHPFWQNALIQFYIGPLWEQGYHAFFLDTLDSYRLFTDSDAEDQAQQDALVAIIHQLRQRFPGIKLMLNRGFEILDRVQNDIVGVAAESLYQRWLPQTHVYGAVPQHDSDWLRDQLHRVRDQYQLPAIAIDYVPASNRQLARETAARIHAEGFIPWVSVAELDQLGVGLIEPVPRRILALYDRASTTNNDPYASSIYSYLNASLDYLGYGVEYRDILGDLPRDTLRGRYAGIIIWLNAPLAHDDALIEWLLRQMDDGLRIALLGDVDILLRGRLGQRMGLGFVSGVDSASLRVEHHDALLGFEGMPPALGFSRGGYRLLDERNQAHLTLIDRHHHRTVPVVTGPWGGVVRSPWTVQMANEGQQRLIIDPFAFLERALALEPFPVPDATTENGSRYWLTHIDGDAFIDRAEMPGAPWSSQVMLDEILKRYRVPTSVSIIEGEFGPVSLHPELRSAMEPIARQTFALPWVEVATHTYSHPFDWLGLKPGDLAGQRHTDDGSPLNLPIPGYHFSYEREIAGSAEYINRHLAPADKPVSAVFWSGNAVPPEGAMAVAERLGLANINGGNTSITEDNPSLTRVSPMLRPVGDWLQVNAPQTNENVYTHFMTEPKWGFRRVLETFRLTDLPRRLKPIDIYYHYYSASCFSSLRALQQVYDQVLTYETLPLFASEWSRIATQWYQLGVARHLDGSWRITGATLNRTLRLPALLGWPDLQHSQGVVGVREIPQGRYVALDGSPRVTLRLQTTPPTTPHLMRANGHVTEWSSWSGGWRLGMAAEQVPLEVDLSATSGCHIDAPGAQQQSLVSGIGLRYSAPGPVSIEVRCG